MCKGIKGWTAKPEGPKLVAQQKHGFHKDEATALASERYVDTFLVPRILQQRETRQTKHGLSLEHRLATHLTRDPLSTYVYWYVQLILLILLLREWHRQAWRRLRC